jgi:hypothetical protein
MSGSPVAPPTPQAQQARNALIDVLGPAMMGATVWHGSPHVFDKFDASKIGTGEGAQAYGHGLYLAESPHVAKNYQQQLTERTGAEGQAAYLKRMYKDNALDIARGQLEHPSLTPEARKYAQDVVDALQAGRVNDGALYKVDLPDSAIAKMLDWDAKLSQQSPEVQSALRKHMGPEWDKTWDNFQGVNAYDVLAGGRHGNPAGNVDAANKLRAAGIPGIRYLDGGSRGTGAGTSNYVIFPGNESLLQILERNGVPLR